MLPNIFEALICIPSRPPSIASFPSEGSASYSSSESSKDESARFVFVRRKLHPERDKKQGIRWKFRNGRVVLLEQGKKKKRKKAGTKGTGLFRRVLSDITTLSEKGTESIHTEAHSPEEEDNNIEEAQDLVEPNIVLSDRSGEEKESDNSDHEEKEDDNSDHEEKEDDNSDHEEKEDDHSDHEEIEGDNNDEDSPSIYSRPSHESEFEAETSLLDSDYTPGRASPHVRMYAGVAGDGTRRPLYLASTSPADSRGTLERLKASTLNYWHAVVKVTKKGGKWILSELHVSRKKRKVESKAHSRNRNEPIPRQNNELHGPEHLPPSVDETQLRAEPRAHNPPLQHPIQWGTNSLYHPEHLPRSVSTTGHEPASTVRRFTIFKSAALGRPSPGDRFWILSKRGGRKLMHPPRNVMQTQPDSPTMVVSPSPGLTGSTLLGVAPTFSVRRKPVPVGAEVVRSTSRGVAVVGDDVRGAVSESEVESTLAGTTVVGHDLQGTGRESIAESTLAGSTVVGANLPDNHEQRNINLSEAMPAALEPGVSVAESNATQLVTNAYTSTSGYVNNPIPLSTYTSNPPDLVYVSDGPQIPELLPQHSGRVSPVEQVYGRNSVNFRLRAEANDVSTFSDAETVIGEG